MSRIGYGYGSEWHLLRYLGYHRDFLNDKIRADIPALKKHNLHWLDFNFSKSNEKLKQDEEHKAIDIFKCKNICSDWKNYWAQSGNVQNWDAVAISPSNEGIRWLFVEAKAHCGEISSDCGATSKISLQIIEAAFKETINNFGLTPSDISDWFKNYYQFANRLAFLNYLLKHGIDAHLLFLYFYGDEVTPNCPQLPSDWNACLTKMYAHIGFNSTNTAIHRVHKLFLSTNPNIIP